MTECCWWTTCERLHLDFALQNCTCRTKNTHTKNIRHKCGGGQVVCRVTWPLVLSDTQGLICTITAATKVGTPSNSTDWSRWDWSTGFITGTRRHSDLFPSLVSFSSGLLFKNVPHVYSRSVMRPWLDINGYSLFTTNESVYTENTTSQQRLRSIWEQREVDASKFMGGWWRRRGAGVNGQTIK